MGMMLPSLPRKVITVINITTLSMVLKGKSYIYLLWRAEVSLFRSITGVGQILQNKVQIDDKPLIKIEFKLLPFVLCQCLLLKRAPTNNNQQNDGGEKQKNKQKTSLTLVLVVVVPDSAAQRRPSQCKSQGSLYSYMCVYHGCWTPAEPPGQRGAKFRSDTVKENTPA